ncbi:MAG: hypothetical protein HY459_01930, partial [Parcubacteria group bacterium]|nr:hypothetical protein [Parcubacteria group bacterium]
FGYEAILQNLTQIEERVFANADTAIVRQIRSIPDFLVIKNKNPMFVEVKYFSSLSSFPYRRFKSSRDLIEQLARINQFWKAKVIFVTPKPPFFLASDPPYYQSNKLVFHPLLEDNDLEIPQEVLKDCGLLVEKYYPISNSRE